MKIHLLLLPLLALLPVTTWAQTEPTPPGTHAPQISIDPAAKALLDRARATYKKASGLSFEVKFHRTGKDERQATVLFQRPGLIRINYTGASSVRVLDDGSNLYTVQNTTYSKKPSPPDRLIGLRLSLAGLAGVAIGQMLDGTTPVEFFENLYTQKPFSNTNIETVALAPQIIDGEMMSGVKSKMSYEFSFGEGNSKPSSQEITFWFAGPDALLRRVDVISLLGDKNQGSINTITTQKLNPTFAPDAFKFDANGLKLSPSR